MTSTAPVWTNVERTDDEAQKPQVMRPRDPAFDPVRGWRWCDHTHYCASCGGNMPHWFVRERDCRLGRFGAPVTCEPCDRRRRLAELKRELASA